jgi:hypothetical protein
MAILIRGLPSAQAKRRKEKLKEKEKLDKKRELELTRIEKCKHAQHNKELGEEIREFIDNHDNLRILEYSDFYFVVAKNLKLTVVETNTNNRFMPRSAPVEKCYTIVFRILYGSHEQEVVDMSSKGFVYNTVSKMGCKTVFVMDASEIGWVLGKIG